MIRQETLDKIDLMSDISQFISLYLLLQDATNNELMQELQHQNTEYFEKIVKELEELKGAIEECRANLEIIKKKG